MPTAPIAAIILLLAAVGSANAQDPGMRARAPGLRETGAATLATGGVLIEISKPEAGFALTCDPAVCRVNPKIRFSRNNLSLLRYQAVSIKLSLCDDLSGCRATRGAYTNWMVPYPVETDLAQNGLTAPGRFRLLWEINDRPAAAYSTPLTLHANSASPVRK